MASIKKITDIIAAIKTIYAYYARDTDVQTLVKTWGTLLKDYPDDEVDKALYMCLQTCKTPPTPADLIERLNAMKAAGEPTDEELWDLLKKSLWRAGGLIYLFPATMIEANGRTQGANARDQLEKLWDSLPEKLRMYLGGKGEFMRMAQHYDEEELKYERNRFMKTMPTIRTRHEYRQLQISAGENQASGFLEGGGGW